MSVDYKAKYEAIQQELDANKRLLEETLQTTNKLQALVNPLACPGLNPKPKPPIITQHCIEQTIAQQVVNHHQTKRYPRHRS